MSLRALLLLLLVALIRFDLVQAAETILEFHSDIEILSSAELLVEETIRVRAAGDQIKRGIYRDFPTDYKDAAGHKYRVGFELLEVRRDNYSEPYRTEQRGNGVRIYIGDKNIILPPGDYSYSLRYRTNRQLGYFDQHDELYWNVTGNGWAFPITQASARVKLPKGVPADSIGGEAYTGYQGSKGTDYEAWIEDSGQAVFRTTRPLAAQEGLTIVTSWAKGFVREPTRDTRLDYFLADNRQTFYGGAGMLVLLMYYLAAWFKVGRDPAAGLVVPLYEPAKGYSPAAMRFIRHMGYDNKTFAAAVVNLAVNGYLRIHEDGSGEFTLEKLGKQVPIAAGEGAIASALFGNGKSKIRLTQSNHQTIGKAVKAHKRSLKADYEKSHFLNNSGYILPGLLISLLSLGAGVLALPNSEAQQTSAFLMFWLSGWTLGVYALVTAALTAWRGGRMLQAIPITLFALPFIGFELFALWALASEGSLSLVVLLLAAIALNVLFYQWLKAPTHAGRRVLDQIDGFRQFLNVAEQNELDLRHPPEKTAELFEKYLPYALALDVEQHWAQRFASVIGKSSHGNQGYHPGWYHGRNFHRRHDVGHLAAAVGGAMSTAIAAAATAPGSSSGGSGGGSSGGGGGGGGGGGW